MGILLALLPLLLRLVGLGLDNAQANEELKKQFLSFVNEFEKQNNSSVTLHSSFEDQRQKLKALGQVPPPPPKVT